jgi:hypothetical protein
MNCLESLCILCSMRIWFFAFFLTMPLLAVAQTTCAVPDKLWEWPRSGQAVVAMPELRACVQGFLDKPDAAMVIHHALTDEAALHAAELRYWLIALALDGARIDLKNDLQTNEPITVEVMADSKERK